jgi:hypothetical protein
LAAFKNYCSIFVQEFELIIRLQDYLQRGTPTTARR